MTGGLNQPDGCKEGPFIDKVYQRKNLEMAWEMVKANRGLETGLRFG